jgi:predicted ATPase
MLRSASKVRQIVVATQSVNLLDELATPEEVIVVERKGPGPGSSPESTFRRLDAAALQSWLEEYTLGELWEKNVLGGRP